MTATALPASRSGPAMGRTRQNTRMLPLRVSTRLCRRRRSAASPLNFPSVSSSPACTSRVTARMLSCSFSPMPCISGMASSRIFTISSRNSAKPCRMAPILPCAVRIDPRRRRARMAAFSFSSSSASREALSSASRPATCSDAAACSAAPSGVSEMALCTAAARACSASTTLSRPSFGVARQRCTVSPDTTISASDRRAAACSSIAAPAASASSQGAASSVAGQDAASRVSWQSSKPLADWALEERAR
mmetsp:Transcript_17685/g.42650  ORF Transcript_17685/g.42650 Transcript_17685/m.42650 type:complete len:248 (+) Transcript_17685:1920-2663(+)